MSNNLFYDLYSHSKERVKSPYVCPNALDAAGTAFQIINRQGIITDSNGNTLSSIDFSGIYSDGITQYVSETKIIEPYSCVVLQGLTFGLAYGTYYFIIPKPLIVDKTYDKYLDISFEIVANIDFKPTVTKFGFTANGTDSITALINKQFQA